MIHSVIVPLSKMTLSLNRTSTVESSAFSRAKTLDSWVARCLWHLLPQSIAILDPF